MKQHNLLILIISSFILTVLWVGANIYHSHVTTTITDTQNLQISPINPHFDTTVITNLKKRTVVEPAYDAEIPASSAANSPTPSSSPVRSITPSETPPSTSPGPTSTSASLTP